jgi:hypothetical protein
MNALLRLSTTLFVVLVLLVPATLYSAETAPQDGVAHVVLGSGQVVARGTDGTERRLQRRSSLYTGDTVVAGSNAFVQIRFTDGGLVSLRSDSEFRIDDYQFKGEEDGSEKATFSLLKGGLRTISGRIGKTNKANYRMNTPVATIGIRGTHYGVRLCVGDCGPGIPDGWYIGVLEGSIVFTVGGKEYICNAGEYYFIPLDGGPPVIQVTKGVVFGGFPDEDGAPEGQGRHRPGGYQEPPISGPKRDTLGGGMYFNTGTGYYENTPWD